ncbi:hypothetical protein F2P79_019375 [Pimephales promelas]|nr:hypothetical protein F2P79_019375 [Pimephales promelas]
MPSKKQPQGIKPSQPQHDASDNMATVDQTAGLALEEKDMSRMMEKISEKIISAFDERFDKLEATLQTIQTAQRELSERVDVVEEQASDHETRIHSLETSLDTLSKENKMLKFKLNDLEGRSRRNNIRIIGIPEGAEKGRPTEFVAELIKQLFEDFSDPPIIDRAHRVPQPKPPEGAKSRAIIARMHYFQDKERILHLRQGRQLDYQGRKVLFFPDYTAEVMEQRRSFSEAMQSLRELNVRHTLRFPAKLCITYNDRSSSKPPPSIASVQILNRLIEERNMVDIWRLQHPTEREYSFYSQLDKIAKEDLERAFSEADILEAIKSFPSGKAPGPDGFGYSVIMPFIWAYKTPRIAKAHLQKPTQMGGLGLPTVIWPYNFRDHGIADGITELAN